MILHARSPRLRRLRRARADGLVRLGIVHQVQTSRLSGDSRADSLFMRHRRRGLPHPRRRRLWLPLLAKKSRGKTSEVSWRDR